MHDRVFTPNHLLIFDDRRAVDQQMLFIAKFFQMLVRDAETGHEMYLDTSSRKVQRMPAQYWAESEAKLKDVFSRSKIDWVSVATNDDYVRAMMRLFGSRI